MKKYHRLAILLFASALVIIGTMFVLNSDTEDRVDVDTSFADEASSHFTTRLNDHLIERIGQPIEGFEPGHYMQEFSQLEPEDFDEAGAVGGSYSFNGETLAFISSNEEGVATSADGSLTNNGLERVYFNVVLRLRREIESIADVNTLISDISIIEGGINSFEDCIAAGNPAMESHPRQCRTEDDQYFIEILE